MTPRKLQALMLVHYDIKKQENGEKSTRHSSSGRVDGFIDNIPGW